MLLNNHLLLFLPAALALVIPRELTFGQVIMDLVAVDSATKDLLDKVNALGKPKTILDAFPILISRNAAEATLKKATDDATNNPTNYQFSVEQAQDVGQLVRGSLIPDVGSLLQAMKDKKVSFNDINVTGIVIDSIATLSKMTDNLADAWLALTPDQGTLIKDGKADKAMIDGYYQDCYSYYTPVITRSV